MDVISVIEHAALKLSAEQRLLGMMHLGFDYASWLLSWYRAYMSGFVSPRGMSISRIEFEGMGIDSEELLSLLIAGDMEDEWVEAASSYDYLEESGRTRCALPGTDINGVRFLQIQLKPEPFAFSYARFLIALRSFCENARCDYRDFLFPHYKRPCEDPERFLNGLLNYECDPVLVARELEIGRIRAEERVRLLFPHPLPAAFSTSIAEVLSLFQPQNIHALRKDDPRIQRTIRRPVMARLTGRTADTIRKWDQKGVSVGDIIWPQPRRSLTDLPEYFLPDYLDALQQLIPRIRNRERDRQLRDEIIGQKYAE